MRELKAEKIRDLTEAEIEQKIRELHEEIFNLRFRNSMRQLQNPLLIREKRREYDERIDIYRIASEFFIDAVVPAATIRDELCRRFAAFATKPRRPVQRWNGVIPG